MECLVTHPSDIRTVLDYVIIALKGGGRIIAADAPVQGCNFNELQKRMHYDIIWSYYASENIKIEAVDLRGKKLQRINLAFLNRWIINFAMALL